MLNISAASSCDICYDLFDHDQKAPWSIACGHVFCAECLHNVTDPRACPMCRSTFEESTCIKLHVDFDGTSDPATADTPEAKAARRFQHGLVKLTESGGSEASLRQLIAEGAAFLHGQQPHMYKELRTAHRMVRYLFETKISYRQLQQEASQWAKKNAEMAEENATLAKEKLELFTQLEKLEETHEYAMETAVAVEKTLREHCAQAKQAHKVTTEQMKKLQEENEGLREQLRKLSIKLPTGAKTAQTPPESKEAVTADKYFEIPPAFSKLDMSNVAIHDASSFLISPLPQFTSTLPANFEHFTPLPELAEDEDESQGASTDEEDEEVVTPDGSQHKQPLRPTEAIRQQFHPEPAAAPLPVPKPPHEPSGLSRTAPFRDHRRRERSSSSPTRPTSRSQSPFDLLTSGSTSPPSQPAPSHHNFMRDPHATAPTQLRSRLHDILSDSPLSSSLPSSSSSSSSFPRDAANMFKEERPHTHTHAMSSRPNEASQQVQGNHTHAPTLAARLPPRSGSPTHHVSQRVSSASAEAKKLEEERRRKHREEKYGVDYDKHMSAETRKPEDEWLWRPREEKYSADYDKPQMSAEKKLEDRWRPREEKYGGDYEKPNATTETKKVEEERRRMPREDKYGADYEKPNSDPDRDHRRYASSNMTVAALSSASQAARREHHPYGNPTLSESTSSLKRSATSSGIYARPSGHAQDQPPVPSGRHMYNSNTKNPTKGSGLQPSHGPPVYT